jgi:hypothetical protein
LIFLKTFDHNTSPETEIDRICAIFPYCPYEMGGNGFALVSQWFDWVHTGLPLVLQWFEILVTIWHWFCTGLTLVWHWFYFFDIFPLNLVELYH